MNNNYEKIKESKELAQLVQDFLDRGGKIEYVAYVAPDAETIKQIGFMRKFVREVEYV